MRAYDSGEVDGDELATAVKRYDDFGSRERANLEEMADVAGEDVTKLAARTDRDTLNDIVSLGCGGATPSIEAASGGGSSVGSDAYYAVATPGRESAALGTSGSCLSEEAADDLRRGLARAADSDGLSSYEKIDGAVETIEDLDPDKKEAAADVISETDIDAVRFLDDADPDTAEDVLSVEIDTGDSADNLGKEVQAGLVKEYSRGHFSLDGWAGDVYPNADNPAEVAGKLATDIQSLEENPDVEGVTRLVTKEGGTGSYLTDLPAPKYSDNPVKGAALEARTARVEARKLDDGETLKLSYEPDVDFSKLEGDSDALGEIAERVYGSRDESDIDAVKKDLGINDGAKGKQSEFDALQATTGSDSETIYYEAKNRDEIKKRNIEDQASRYLATRIIKGDTNLDNTEMVVVTRTESQANELRDEITGSWLTVKKLKTT